MGFDVFARPRAMLDLLIETEDLNARGKCLEMRRAEGEPHSKYRERLDHYTTTGEKVPHGL